MRDHFTTWISRLRQNVKLNLWLSQNKRKNVMLGDEPKGHIFKSKNVWYLDLQGLMIKWIWINKFVSPQKKWNVQEPSYVFTKYMLWKVKLILCFNRIFSESNKYFIPTTASSWGKMWKYLFGQMWEKETVELNGV